MAWFGRWEPWWRGRYRRTVLSTPSDGDGHLRLEQAFRECPGLWVAVDRRTGEVRAAASSPYELAGRIKSELIRGVDVLRAPGADEPEVVGFG